MAETAVTAAGFIDLTPDGLNDHAGEALLIDGGRITGFIPVNDLPDDIARLDFPDAFCMPGLVDAAFLPGLIVSETGARPEAYGQSAWAAKGAAERWLDGGVTTAGSMGGADALDFDLSRCVMAGRVRGPRIGPALTPLVPAGAAKFHRLYGVREVGGRDDARRAARELIKHGADRIVVYADVPLEFHPDPFETSRHRLCFSADELSEIVTQAAQAGLYVHAQAISTQAIDVCIGAGVRSIGCAYGLKDVHLPLLAEKGIALAPNLALGATIAELGPGAGFPAGAVQMVAAQRIRPDLLMQAHEASVPVICGTNTAFLAGDVARECLELHRAGLGAADVLLAATLHAARALHAMPDYGAFRAGWAADMVFMRRSPLNHVEGMGEVRAVVSGGEVVRG
jgi:imidazolonepropionase-like amidohydrolase